MSLCSSGLIGGSGVSGSEGSSDFVSDVTTVFFSSVWGSVPGISPPGRVDTSSRSSSPMSAKNRNRFELFLLSGLRVP